MDNLALSDPSEINQLGDLSQVEESNLIINGGHLEQKIETVVSLIICHRFLEIFVEVLQ